MNVKHFNPIQPVSETAIYEEETYTHSPIAAGLPNTHNANANHSSSQNNSSSPYHSGGNNKGSPAGASLSQPVSPTNMGTASGGLVMDLPHEERIAAAGRVRAKAWPLMGRDWYPEYHCAAYAGWMSVPGGLCVHKGQYHVFYQHHPYSENWGPMHWGHCVSDDLVHWRHLPIALAPGDSFDRDGCFSGSAVSHQGKLYIFYTGHMWGYSTNVDSEGIYQQQCIAVSEDDGLTFTKLGSVIRPPLGYIHFRDPKVWYQDGRWWMVVGARDVSKDVGQLLLYSTKDLEEWDEVAYRVVSRADDKNVFMWECPDFFPVTSVPFKESGFCQANPGALLRARGKSITFDPSSNNFGAGSFSEGSMGNEPTTTTTTGETRNGEHCRSYTSSSFVSNNSSSLCTSAAGALASSDFVLLYCPQGMSGQGVRYRNRFQSGYLTGHWGTIGGTGVHRQKSGRTKSFHSSSPTVTTAAAGGGGGGARKEFVITQHFKELDFGHDFYAPQTFVAPDGRRILIGWLDMWESPMPTKEHGWSGVLTIPRELTYDCTTQRISMHPVREMSALRVAAASVPAQVICENGALLLVENCTAFEVSLTFNLDNSTGEKFGLWLGCGAEVFYDAQTDSVTINRHYPEYMLSGYRSCPLDVAFRSTLLHLHLFIDRSTIELFINNGAFTMSSRVYPRADDRKLRVFTIGGVADLVEGTVWKLETEAVKH